MSVYKITYGKPEKAVPTAFAPVPRCEVLEGNAFFSEKISFKVTKRGCELLIPIDAEAEIYGFGLQLKRVCHKGRKRYLRPNSDPVKDTGDTHAPVPFFVTNRGFGVFLDTARYATFYCGRDMRLDFSENNSKTADFSPDITDADGDNFVDKLYGKMKGSENSFISVDIPVAEGIDVYYITGDTPLSIVSEYNMLSGGGCMPPMWGLGCLYRADMRFNQQEVLDIAKELRSSRIPCDVLGIEPSWQSHSYSSSFSWSEDKFPNPSELMRELSREHFRVNLWEQAFIHPTSPLYREMLDKSGDYLVWNGLVPDFAEDRARTAFADYHREKLISLGVSGFKLDECDSGDYTGGWSFPDNSSFPSGLDGEQYHSLFGTLYVKALNEAFGTSRTMGQVRNLGSLSASYPYVLYSDLYNHKDFITGIVNSGFSGLLWAPEVRHAENREDMLRRVETVVFSAQCLFNACYLKELPWKKHGCTDEVRELIRIRMSLVPYLFSAFYEYFKEGKPPVRALACDFSNEAEALSSEDEYMFGNAMLVAPIASGESSREVWLPRGEWYDFFTGEKYSGGTHTLSAQHIPVFVKGGSVLPLAEPVEFIDRDTVFNVTLRAYGCQNGQGEALLVTDSDDTYNAEYTLHRVKMNTRGRISDRYNIVGT